MTNYFKEAMEALDELNSNVLTESKQSDELIKLDTEITALEAEIKDLKTKYEAASDKYRNELKLAPEYKALATKYEELQSELWGLEWSYRRHDPHDRDGDEWERDEEQYEKVKDRIEELEKILKEMSDAYWAPSTQARDRADKEFAFSDKKQKLKANQDKRAQGLANLIAEETSEITRIVDKLNKDFKESMFTLDINAATFKANKLRVPMYSKEFEEDYELDEDDFEDFDEDDSPASIQFDCERYEDYNAEDKICDLEIHPEALAETYGYKEVTDGYKIIEESEWILTRDTEMSITEAPEVLKLEYGDDGIGHYEYWGYTGYDSRPYVAIESASDTIKYQFVYYLQKDFGVSEAVLEEAAEEPDNAVVDCKVNKVIAHSEDEKPVDCLGEKKPLEKPLTEEPNKMTGDDSDNLDLEEAVDNSIVLKAVSWAANNLTEFFKIVRDKTPAPGTPEFNKVKLAAYKDLKTKYKFSQKDAADIMVKAYSLWLKLYN